ncbi:MAG TPA: hypothetical protein VEK56_18780 [Vicinamibacterales bacterium]|nr:hypothetical protein [Vicinamibacterales bacterium]
MKQDRTNPPGGAFSPRRGSAVRFGVGVALCLIALPVMLYGFFAVARVLERGGYGIAAVRDALAILGLSGVLLATGIATIIWDVSKRYEQ